MAKTWSRSLRGFFSLYLVQLVSKCNKGRLVGLSGLRDKDIIYPPSLIAPLCETSRYGGGFLFRNPLSEAGYEAFWIFKSQVLGKRLKQQR